MRSAALQDWYQPERCTQILSWVDAVSLKLVDIVCPVVLKLGRNISGFERKEKSITVFPPLATKSQIPPRLSQVKSRRLCRAQQMLLFGIWKHAEKPAQSFGCHQKLKTELNNPEWNFFSTLCTFITKTRPIGHVGQTASLHKHAVRWSEWHHRDKWIRQSSDLRLLVFLPTMWENNVWL